ncbi:MAG TPA: protein translocase subunit SecD [Nocardioides sp.]|jgi:preprotein translocase subunit SecD|uniref:protein translocase subunit SecD n=1 Tax=Nocardioides sp. TaxID=35761 RepID=UPI002E3315D2|nr:protein translocase subunit SecD [Nocardioides sp.]HEX3932770.1 protein translocase subunit SecD [Nocardioides sp.]
MARSSARPGRTVTVFFIGLAVAYGLVALIGTWKPALGLDLQGGTQITLIANGSVKKDELNQAASIIDDRVNASGVSEATVTTQGSDEIVVQVPGSNKNSLVQTVIRQARLRFRLVAEVPQSGTTTTPSTTPEPSPGIGVTLPPKPHKSGTPKSGSTKQPSSSSTGKNRPPALLGQDKQKPKKGKATKGPTSSSNPSSAASTGPAGTAPTSTSQLTYTAANKKSFSDPLTWMTSPDPQSLAVYNAYSCASKAPVVDNATIPIVTCDDQGQKYLLSPAVIEGTEIKSASATAPGSQQGQVDWEVALSLKSHGADVQRELSQQMQGNQSELVAIVLDGKVVTATYFKQVIPDGTSTIQGNFKESTAKSLATSLKYGALPISFDQTKTTIEVIGPSLAGDQLSAGITAGVAGLILVMLYCLFYYRGLGLVVISSLIVAGATTYAMVLLLAKGAGFTLTLPGIAGLIVAVGITADSFIVFFERIRDEMRSGKSMRVAVEAGWIRARATCVAADAVSILAAVVLYLFAAGVVKGFAFALGLSTVIDLAVFFWFTKPMVSWLARFDFFNKGHKLSGLDAENLGLDRLPAGGRA